MRIVAKSEIFMKTRILRGMTQRELARKSGLSRAYISLIESGGKSVGPSAAKKLSDILGKQMEDLFSIKNER